VTSPLARSSAAVLLVLAAVLAGCSSGASDHAVDDAARAVPRGDPGYALDRLRHDDGEIGGAPTSLDESLPNHRIELGDTGKVVAYSDALVIGTVTSVSKGSGVIWRDEDDFRLVDYDDASASTRSAIVTMSVEAATGAVDPEAGTFSFRVLVPADADPQRFAESLAALGRIAVVLDRDPSKVETVPWRPLMNDSLIGLIADDGSFTLPGLTRGRTFAGEIHTTDDLLAAARAPATTTTVDLP
jgi:hypothetical protein